MPQTDKTDRSWSITTSAVLFAILAILQRTLDLSFFHLSSVIGGFVGLLALQALEARGLRWRTTEWKGRCLIAGSLLGGIGIGGLGAAVFGIR